MPRARTGRLGDALLATLLWAALLLGLWVALTDNTRPSDLLAGFGCALAAGLATHLAARAGGMDVQVRGRWLLRALAAPWWIVRDSALVLGALAGSVLRGRRPAGRFRPVRFQPGGDEPLARGRRALAASVGSAGPNQYVVAASQEDAVLVVHELRPASSVSAVDLVEEP